MLEIKVDNGKVTFRGKGNLMGICVDLCTAIDHVHTDLVQKDPLLGKAFRYTFTTILEDKGMPLWSGNTEAMGGTQITIGQDDEKSRPGAGTPKRQKDK